MSQTFDRDATMASIRKTFDELDQFWVRARAWQDARADYSVARTLYDEGEADGETVERTAERLARAEMALLALLEGEV